MIKTDENLNISVESQLICNLTSEQDSLFVTGQNESKECYATVKTDENLNISVESQLISTQPSEQGSFLMGVCTQSGHLRYIELNMNATENILVNYNVIELVHFPSQMSCTAWR